MPKIAIVIGVSAYTRQQPLPACNNDAALIRFVLDQSNAYEDILFLSGASTRSDEAKHLLTQFVDKHKGRTDLDEVFFFYSGHGQFFDDEFYYLFSDFDEPRRNRSSLKNSELDSYLRILGPKLAVKVVDACNAGVQYVKDASDLSAMIKKESIEQGLNKVYFLFSSLLDQSSFASSEISDYTKSFVEAIYTSRRPEIRYRDIIDQIADAFHNNKEQRPFFVIQADNTEIFGVFEENDRASIRSRFEAALAKNAGSLVALPSKQPTLYDLIKEQAKDYLSASDIVEAINQLLTRANQFSLPTEIRDLFKVNVETAKSLHGLRGLGEIGKWLQENKTDYFAKVVTKTEEYEAYPSALLAALSLTGEPGRKILKQRVVVSGYEPMWDAPAFWRIGLILGTQFPNVPTYKLNILYLFSKLDIRIFYSIDEELPAPGDFAGKTEYGSWKALQLRLRQLKDDSNSTNPIFTDFTAQLTEKLRQIAGVPKEEPAELNIVSEEEALAPSEES